MVQGWVSWCLMLYGSRKVFMIQAHATHLGEEYEKVCEQLFTLAEVSSFIVHFVEIRKGIKVAKTHQNRPRLSAECLGNPQRKSHCLFRYCLTKHLLTCKSHYAVCTSHYSLCFVGIETLSKPLPKSPLEKSKEAKSSDCSDPALGQFSQYKF